jgi:hypothetical protein
VYIAAGRYRSRFRIRRPTLSALTVARARIAPFVYRMLNPVAIAPGSVFVVPRCQRLLWRARIERFVYCSL